MRGMQVEWYDSQADLTCRYTCIPVYLYTYRWKGLAEIQWESFVLFWFLFSTLMINPNLWSRLKLFGQRGGLAMTPKTFVCCISLHLSTAPIWLCQISYPDTNGESWQWCRGPCCGGSTVWILLWRWRRIANACCYGRPVDQYVACHHPHLASILPKCDSSDPASTPRHAGGFCVC